MGVTGFPRCSGGRRFHGPAGSWVVGAGWGFRRGGGQAPSVPKLAAYLAGTHQHVRRTVPLPQVVAEALSAHLAELGRGTHGSLFATVHGNPYRSDYYVKLVRAVVARTGLPKGTTSHHLRHHDASLLLAAGESVVGVAARLGHENASLVLSTYGHLMPDSEERIRRAVDEAWCGPEVPRERQSGR